METIALLSLLGLVYLLFQGWFWRLLAVFALLGLGMLVLAWLIAQVFGA